MYCESCGSLINSGEAFCSNCGTPVPQPAPSTPAPAPQAVVQPIAQPAPQPQYQQPVYQQPQYQQPQYQQPVYQQPMYQPRTYQQPVRTVQPIYQQTVYQQPIVITPIDNRKRVNGAATAGLVLGIIALCLSWLPMFNTIPSALGLIFSIVGVARKGAGGKGRAIAGLIMSSIGLLITAYVIFYVVTSGELDSI